MSREQKLIGTDSAFTETERNVIASIANATIGPDDSRSMPGAGDSPILSTILDKASHFESRIKAGIANLLAEADPLTLSPAELISTLDRDPRFRSFSRTLTIVILQAYYQDARVLEALGVAARPPFPLGHEVESGDWSLLDPVKRRDPIYRPVSR